MMWLIQEAPKEQKETRLVIHGRCFRHLCYRDISTIGESLPAEAWLTLYEFHLDPACISSKVTIEPSYCWY